MEPSAVKVVAYQLRQGWKNAHVAAKPLELILARNLLTSISTPAFLVDEEAVLVFYNEAAAALLGRSFEETGQMSPEEWTATFGPFAEGGDAVTLDDLPTTQAVRDGRPMHANFTIRSANGSRHAIEASALPIVANEEGSSGAMVFFWPTDTNGSGEDA
jgi:PAS domain-containing protein